MIKQVQRDIQEHREAPDTMKDITEQYDKSKSDAQAGNESEYI